MTTPTEIYKYIAKYLSDKQFGPSLSALTNILSDFLSVYMKDANPDYPSEEVFDSLIRSFNVELKETYKKKHGFANDKKCEDD